MRPPNPAPTPTPTLARFFSPLEDVDVDDDGDVCNVFIAVEGVDEAVVVGMVEADMALVVSIVIEREFEADEE